MIICTKCGFENEDGDAFCGSCSAFLEWSGQKASEPEPEPEPEPIQTEAEPEPEHAGIVERVRERMRGDSRTATESPDGPVPEGGSAAVADNGAATASNGAARIDAPTPPAGSAPVAAAAPPGGPAVGSGEPSPAAGAPRPAEGGATGPLEGARHGGGTGAADATPDSWSPAARTESPPGTPAHAAPSAAAPRGTSSGSQETASSERAGWSPAPRAGGGLAAGGAEATTLTAARPAPPRPGTPGTETPANDAPANDAPAADAATTDVAGSPPAAPPSPAAPPASPSAHQAAPPAPQPPGSASGRAPSAAPAPRGAAGAPGSTTPRPSATSTGAPEAGTGPGAPGPTAPGPTGPARPAARPASATGPTAPVAPVTPAASAVGPATPGAVEPQAVKPGAAKTKPAPRPAAPQRRVINPGDRICGGCGDGNPPERNWCRRCGASLKEAEVFHPSFWKRLRAKLRRRRKARAAGERPNARRRMFGGAGPGWLTSTVTKILAVAVIVFLVLCFFGPWKRTIRHHLASDYHTVANVVHPSYDPVRAVGATASSQAPGHPAIFAVDGASNTSWWTNGNGVGQTLTIQIGAPTQIDKIGFIIGDTDTPSSFDQEARPLLVLLNFGGGPKPYSKTEVMSDSPNFQSFTVSSPAVTSITLTIESVAGGQANSNTALAEVELFSLKR